MPTKTDPLLHFLRNLTVDRGDSNRKNLEFGRCKPNNLTTNIFECCCFFTYFFTSALRVYVPSKKHQFQLVSVFHVNTCRGKTTYRCAQSLKSHRKINGSDSKLKMEESNHRKMCVDDACAWIESNDKVLNTWVLAKIYRFFFTMNFII